MRERKVSVLVDKPQHKNILGGKWIYSVERNEKNEIIKFKAKKRKEGEKR